MPKTKEQKGEILRDLADKISRAKSVIFAKFNRLKVKDNEALRKELKSEGSEYYVAKKTLMDLAFKNSKAEGLNVREFDGRVAAIFGYEDEVSPAKTVDKYRKSLKGDGVEETIEFVGGILNGKYMNAEEVKFLAGLPSKQELYAKIVGSINAPVSGFVNVLAGNFKKLVYVLKAIEEKK